MRTLCIEVIVLSEMRPDAHPLLRLVDADRVDRGRLLFCGGPSCIVPDSPASDVRSLTYMADSLMGRGVGVPWLAEFL
jgi:hypothetical protein